nr:hypothetical protein [Acidipropionibacterium virtanenii]
MTSETITPAPRTACTPATLDMATNTATGRRRRNRYKPHKPAEITRPTVHQELPTAALA